MVGNKIIFIAFALGTVIGGVAGSVLTSSKGGECVRPASVEIVAEDVDGVTDQVEKEECDFKVEVAGAVARAGVVCVRKGELVDDALRKVGGVEKTMAAYKYVTQNLNLAKKLQEEEKIYVPYQNDVVCKKKEDWDKSPVEVAVITVGEVKEASKGSTSTDKTSNEVKLTTCVSINNASSTELETLTGVGPSTAAKIIVGRPYSKLDDLKNVSGIGDATYEKLKAQICL